VSEKPSRRASLEVLRAEASDELRTVVHERLRAGEDPWDFMPDLPTVDELVVHLLRAELPAAADLQAYRQIALAYPPLTTTVWQLLGHALSGRGLRWSA